MKPEAAATPSINARLSRIPMLDGWRAIAIGLVIAHHVGQNLAVDEASYAQSVTCFGQFGVDIFFGLSGLLITRLLLQEHSRAGSFNLPQFYIRRTFRILPACFVFLAAYTMLGLWKSNVEFLSSVFFFRNYAPVQLTGFGSGHLWSLAIEEHFYLLWPGLLALAGPKRGRKLAAALALSFGAWRMLAPVVAPGLFPQVPEHFRTDLRLDALLWGCLAGFALHDPRESKRLSVRLGWSSWIVATALLIFSIRFYWSITSVWVAVLIPLILAGTLVHPEWRISRMLAGRGFAWLGRISYSLYLWQQLFLTPGWEHSAEWWRQWPWNLPAAFVAASLSYYFVEKPAISVGRRLSETYTKIRSSASLFNQSTAPIGQSAT